MNFTISFNGKTEKCPQRELIPYLIMFIGPFLKKPLDAVIDKGASCIKVVLNWNVSTSSLARQHTSPYDFR